MEKQGVSAQGSLTVQYKSNLTAISRISQANVDGKKGLEINNIPSKVGCHFQH